MALHGAARRGGHWERPPLPTVNHQRMWLMYCRSIEQRIAALRYAEGFDSRITAYQTFDPPLAPLAPRVIRPVRLRLMAAPTLPRDPATGRLLPRREVVS